MSLYLWAQYWTTNLISLSMPNAVKRTINADDLSLLILPNVNKHLCLYIFSLYHFIVQILNRDIDHFKRNIIWSVVYVINSQMFTVLNLYTLHTSWCGVIRTAISWYYYWIRHSYFGKIVTSHLLTQLSIKKGFITLKWQTDNMFYAIA